MSSHVVVRPQVERDLRQARDWYNTQRAALGTEFVDEVADTIGEIAERPLSFPKVHGEIRRAIVRRFPYGVFFTPETDRVVILGVAHGRRHPRVWTSRR